MATITKEQLRQAYIERWGSVLPVEDSIFDCFIQEFGTNMSLERAVDLLQDYVASQGLYLEGAEEAW